jgi:hypothetical protein
VGSVNGSRLSALIEKETVDAYNKSEQTTGLAQAGRRLVDHDQARHVVDQVVGLPTQQRRTPVDRKALDGAVVGSQTVGRAGLGERAFVPVPEAEPLAGRHRGALDLASGWGVPAHVTLSTRSCLRRRSPMTDGGLVAAIPAFDIDFARTRWFDDVVVWLSPSRPSGCVI